MKKFLAAVLVQVLFSLSCAVGTTGTDVTANPVADAGTDVGPDEVGVADGSVPYNPCLYTVQQPSPFYPRLLEQYCVGSDEKNHLIGFWDTLLGLDCQFKNASDGIERCLPLNEQSSPEYADDGCQEPIALAALGASPYIGIDVNPGGKESTRVMVYRRGVPWRGTVQYYQVTVGGSQECWPAELAFIGQQFYYLGPVVNPGEFVEQ